MTAALVVGQGSIGRRHARVLAGLGLDVAAVTSRADVELRRFAALPEALEAQAPEYVVIADATDRHGATLRALAAAGYRGRVLVEKPITAVPETLPLAGFRSVHAGYQLRFLPVVRALAAARAGRRVLAAEFYAGQHLADWRPGRDPRDAYSAWRARGGGALRDVSHELDLALWLLGPWRRVAAAGGRLGEVTGDADDAWGILLDCGACALATVQVNMLDRPGARRVVLHTDAGTLRADLLTGRLMVDDRIEDHPTDRDEAHRSMHRAILGLGAGEPCAAAQAQAVVELIVATERAAAERRWVEA